MTRPASEHHSSERYLDLDLFKPESVDPATRAFNAQLATQLAALPPVWSQPAAVTRAQRASGGGAFGPIVFSEMGRNRTIPGPTGPVTIRTFVPETVTGVYLHLHGGGWTLGAADQNDPLLEPLATRAKVAVVSVEYRMGPEHPYPAAPDDCEAAARWLLEHASPEFGSTRLLIGGESAGAHLAAVTLIRLRDKLGRHGFSRANLTYGAYDLTGTPSVRLSPPDALVLPPKAIEWFGEQFVPDAGRRRDPDISPLWADLRDLPAALFSVGTLDPLLDDSLFMHARWVAAGNPAELAVYPGGVHGFVSFPYPLGQRANDRIIEFLKA